MFKTIAISLPCKSFPACFSDSFMVRGVNLKLAAKWTRKHRQRLAFLPVRLAFLPVRQAFLPVRPAFLPLSKARTNKLYAHSDTMHTLYICI